MMATAHPEPGAGDPGLAALVSDCVHCGFCLPACPTYQLWGEEMDSPRGRIHLIGQVLDGAPLTGPVVQHLDRCLGCMACMTACPSGVRYNVLIETARTWTDDRHARPAPPRVLPGGATAAPPPGAGATAAPPPGAGATAQPSGGPRAPSGATTAPHAPGAATAPPGGAGPASGGFRRSLRDRAARELIFATFPYPRRLRVLTAPLRLAQRAGLDRRMLGGRASRWLPPELAAALRLAPRAERAPALPARIPAQGQRRAVVGLLTGCVQDVFFSEVNAATARVLAAEGCDVVIPAGQSCCGALPLHSGRATQAAAFARRTIAEFERAGVETIVLNSAGCGSAMKEYGALLGGAHADLGGDGWAARAASFSSKVRDLSEFLAGLYEDGDGPRAVRHELPVTAVYHDACHLGHAQRIRQQPRDLLRAIPGLKVAEVADGGACCGSAGVYNLLQPEAAAELGARKATAIRAAGGRLVVSANPGCSLQISAALAADGGEPVRVVHTAQVLDASIRGLPVTALTSYPAGR